MQPGLCVCALVCLMGGGGVAHRLLPYCSASAHVVWGSVCFGALDPSREAKEPDAEPAGGDVGLASQPPRHKDKLPNRSTIACRHRKVVIRGTTGPHPHSLTVFGTGGATTWAGTGSPWPRAYPGQVEGPQGAESASLPWVPPS